MIDIYIAFTPSDFVYAERIYKILINEGFKVYMSRPDLLYGAAQPEKEKEALRNASTFIFVTSSTDNANSSYVLSELQYFVNASSKQNQNPHVISILKDINSQDIKVSTKDKSSNHKHSFFRTFCRSLHNIFSSGKSYLSIYPLCLRPEAPLPEDMSDKYNFGTL